MLRFFRRLSKSLPGCSLMTGEPGLPAPALVLVCALLANCTPLPQTLPQVSEITREIAQQTDTEEETVIKKEEQPGTEPEPTVISHGLEEQETIVVVDDDGAGEWQAESSVIREKSEQQVLLAKTQLASGLPTAAVETLLKLDSEVTGKARLETRKTLLKILESLDSLQRALLLEDISDPNLAGWLALLEALAAEGQPEDELRDWRRAWPNHPADATLIDSYTVNRPRNRRQIALLLPLASPDGRAAQAFYDGFAEAHSRDGSWPKAELVLYDIGSDFSLLSLYYRSAEANGADFIVGPLGRKAVESLLADRNLETDTLLLADIPPEKTSDNLYGISLSPENEARQVANKAYVMGHRNASVLHSEGEWGERVANAFIAHWENLDGQLLKNRSFPQDVSSHARVIREFLGIEKSIVRHRLIEAQTGLNLKFSPRRNEDMDFIFLATTAAQGRLIVPQLRFFQAHDVPLYATSYVYTGKPDPAMDADLDGLIFAEMRWILDGIALYKQQKAVDMRREVAQIDNNPEDPENSSPQPDAPEDPPDSGVTGPVPAPDLPTENDQSKDPDDDFGVDTDTAPRRPYGRTALDRLYALGVQSYQIIPRLQILRQNSWMKFTGKAMTIRVNPEGNAVRLPVWAKFESGLAEPLPVTDKLNHLPDSTLSGNPG